MREFDKQTRRTGFVRSTQLWRYTFVLTAIFLLLTNSLSAQNPNPIGVAGKAGDFEIDGDFISGNCATPTCVSTGIDWRSVLRQNDPPNGFAIPGESNVAGENAKWIVDGNSGSDVSASNIEVETFAGTSNKNGDFITLAVGASPYSIDTSNPSAPQKNDLTNIYVRSTTIGTTTWLHMGAETRSVDGTSYLDFEYNQAGISKDSVKMYGPLSLTSTGGRTPRNTSVTPALAGDMLFVVDFSKGGGVPIPRVFEWRAVTKANKPTYAWVEITIPAGKAYIVTNGNDVDPAGQNTAFAGNGAASNTTLALQFVEMGIDLSIFGTFDPCSPDATMLVKTRTSSSYTSELKDFSLFEFAITPQANIEDIANVAVCPSQDVTFQATVSGPGAAASNVHWYKVVTPDNPATEANEEVLSAELVTGGRITISPSGFTSTLEIADVVAADEGTYKAVLTGSTCGAAPEYATLTLNSVNAPIVTLLEPSICDARPTGTLTVCNPLTGGNYYLEQLDGEGKPVAIYHQEVLAYDPEDGALVFEDLVAGYPFTLKVEKDGCEAVATCEDIVSAEECTNAAASGKAPSNLEGVSTVSSVGASGSSIQSDLDQEKELNAYPVPFSESATVEFKADLGGHYVINLYDMRGILVKQLQSGTFEAGEMQKIQVDGRGMAEGMYLIRVESAKGAKTLKLLKKE